MTACSPLCYVPVCGVMLGCGVGQVLDLLRRGSARRTTAETKANEASSRSHAILTMHITQVRHLCKDLCTCLMLDVYTYPSDCPCCQRV